MLTVLKSIHSDHAHQLKKYTTISPGLPFFGLQDGGECWATTSETSYKTYGPSTKCLADGEGGPWALQVYKVNLTGQSIKTLWKEIQKKS